MAANRDDTYQRLQMAVDAWASEVSETHSTLTARLHLDTRRPAFKAIPSEHAKPATPASENPLTWLQERVRVLEMRVREAESDQQLLRAELDYARELLHEQNTAAQTDRDERERYEVQAEEAARALGESQLQLDSLQKELRLREWELVKAQNRIDLLQFQSDPEPNESHAVDPGLRERIDALTQRAVSAEAERDSLIASSREARAEADRMAKESASAQEAAHALVAQVHETSDRLRDTARSLESARADIEELRAQSAAQDTTSQRFEVVQENYDVLVASHMELREEIQRLQQTLIERDLRLRSLSQDHADSPEAAAAPPSASSEMDELARALVENNSTLDAMEESTLGQEFLVQALREELGVLQEQIGRHELDYGMLARALRSELQCHRELAVHREFVIQQQGMELEDLSRQEMVREEAVSEAHPATGEQSRPGEWASEEREILAGELSELRVRIEEKDVALRELSREIEDIKARAVPDVQGADEDTVSRMVATQAELDRARDRIVYLRGRLKDGYATSTQDDAVSRRADSTTTKSEAKTSESSSKSAIRNIVETVRSGDVPLPIWQPNAEIQREIEASSGISFRWIVLLLGLILSGFALTFMGIIIAILA